MKMKFWAVWSKIDWCNLLTAYPIGCPEAHVSTLCCVVMFASLALSNIPSSTSGCSLNFFSIEANIALKSLTIKITFGLGLISLISL